MSGNETENPQNTPATEFIENRTNALKAALKAFSGAVKNDTEKIKTHNKKCPYCGYEWASRKTNPKKCPMCQRWLSPWK